MNSTIPPVHRDELAEPPAGSGAVSEKVSDIGAQAQSSASSASEKATDFSHKASAQFEKVAEKAGEAARTMAEHGREAGQHVQEVAGHMKGAISKSVKEQPMVTLALAAAVGFVVGALWKS